MTRRLIWRGNRRVEDPEESLERDVKDHSEKDVKTPSRRRGRRRSARKKTHVSPSLDIPKDDEEDKDVSQSIIKTPSTRPGKLPLKSGGYSKGGKKKD